MHGHERRAKLASSIAPQRVQSVPLVRLSGFPERAFAHRDLLRPSILELTRRSLLRRSGKTVGDAHAVVRAQVRSASRTAEWRGPCPTWAAIRTCVRTAITVWSLYSACPMQGWEAKLLRSRTLTGQCCWPLCPGDSTNHSDGLLVVTKYRRQREDYSPGASTGLGAWPTIRAET